MSTTKSLQSFTLLRLRVVPTLCLALAAAVCLTVNPAARAATDSWIGNTDATWGTAANWNTNVVPGQDDVLQFGPDGSQGATLSNTITNGTFGGISFLSNASAYTISGNSIFFDSISGDSITNSSAVTQTLSIPITVLPGSHLIATTSSGALTFNDALTLNTGAAIEYSPNTGAITLAVTSNTNGILGGNQFDSTTDYASVNGSGVVGAATYTNIATGALASNAATNYKYTSDSGNLTSANGILVNTILAANTGAARTLTVTGTLGLGSNGGIFVSSGATHSFTVSSGTLTANGGGQITLADAEGGFGGTTQNLLVSSNIVNSGANAVSVATEGTVNLSGSSSFTGGLYVDSGEAVTPNSGGANVLGPNGGNVYVANGATVVFAATGGVTYAQNFTINGTGDGGAGALRFNPNSAGNNQTVSGTITLTGSSNITLGANNSSVITLSGQVTGAGGLQIVPNSSNHTTALEFSNSSNNWTGGLSLKTDGDTMTVDLGANNAIPDGQVNINGSGSTNDSTILNLNGFNDTIDGLVSGGATAANAIVDNLAGSTTSTLTIGGNGGGGTFGGIIQNTGASAKINLTKTGAGTEIFSGANTYTGTTTVNGGELQVTGAGTFGSSTSPLSIGGGTADLGTTSQTVGAVTVTTGASTIQNGSLTGASYSVSNPSGTATISANLLGAAGVTKSGAGGLTLSGANTYSGSTAVNNGTIFLSTSGTNNIASSSGITVSSGATFDVTNVSGAGGFALAGSQSLTNSGTVNGPVTVTGASQVFTNNSAGTAGNVTVNAGTFNNNGTAANATGNAGTLEGSGTYSGTVTVSGGTLAAGALNTVGSVTIGNLVISSGLLDLAFSGANGTAIALSGSANFASDSSLDILQLGAPTSSSYTIFTAPSGITGLTAGLLTTIGRTTYTIDSGELAANVLQIDIGGGADSLVWTGTGGDGVTWENQQVQKNWTNTTQSNVADYFYDGDNVTFNDSNFGNYSVTVSGTVSPGSVLVSSTGAYTIGGSGVVAGTGALTKSGTGSLTLTGANTYNGGTVLNTGVLNINNAGAIGVGTLTINGGIIDSSTSGGVTLATNNAQTWAGGFTFNGSNALNLGTGAVTLTTTPTVTINNGQTLTVGGAIGGSGLGVTLAGNGTLALGGTSTYTGATTVNSGTLGITGALGNTAVTVNSGGAINLENAGAINQNTLTISGGSLNESVNDGISDSGALSVSGATVTLSESNNYTGATTVGSGGTLNLGVAGAISAGAVGVSGGNLAETVTNALTGPASLLVTGGTATLSNANNYSGGTNLNGGTLLLATTGAIGSAGLTLTSGSLDNTTGSPLTVSNAQSWGGTWTFLGSNNLTLGGATTLTANAGVTIDNAATLTESGAIGDGGNGYGITLNGNGTLLLSDNANNFRGNIVVNGGTLTGTSNGAGSGNNGPFGDGQVTGRTITVNSGGTLVFASNNAFGSGAGVVVSALPTLTVNGGAVIGNGYDVLGNIVLENGGSLVAGPQTATGITNSYEAIELAGTVTGTGSTPSTISSGAAGVGLNLGPNTVFNVANITNGGTDLTVSAPLFNQSNDYSGAAGSLTKSGPGNMLLSSSNSYTGATSVVAGTLDLTGSLNGSSSVTVTDATLEGTGFIAKGVTIGSGTGATGSAILEPGAVGVVGTLTTGSSVSLLSDGEFVFNLDSTGGGAGNGSSELLAASVSLDASSEFDLTDISSNPGALTLGDQFTVISTMGGITGVFNNLPNGDIFTAGQNDYEATYASNSLTITVVPEPATWGLLISGLGMLIGIQKLRKHRIGV